MPDSLDFFFRVSTLQNDTHLVRIAFAIPSHRAGRGNLPDSKETKSVDITTSMRALLGEEDLVLKRFYESFLDQDSIIRDLFRDVDFGEQSVMLTSALKVVQLNYVANLPAIWKILVVLGKRHAAIGAPKELYPLFQDCLLETLANYHGPDWDGELERQWREAFEKAFKAMFEGYDTPEND